MPAAINIELRRRGFVFLRRLLEEESTEQIAHLFGRPEMIPGIPRVQILSPKTVSASTPNLYSGNFGLGEFPFHTDLAHWYIPPRYILLRCRRGDAQVFTSLLPWESAVTGLSPAAIQRARFRPRRPVQGEGQLLSFTQQVGNQSLFRWDSLFIVPDNDDALVVADHLKTIDVSSAGERFVLMHPADTLIIDNWRVLHGRGSVHETGHAERLVERIYLQEIENNG